MSVNSSDGDQSRAASPLKNAIGWLLVAAAFLIALAPAFTADDAYRAGQKSGQLMAYALVFFLIATIVMRKRSPNAKANARIVIGSLLVLFAFGSLPNGMNSRAKEMEVGRKFMADAVALSKKHEQRFAELGQRMEKLDTSNILMAKNVMSNGGFAKSRATVAQYRAFIAERGEILKSNLKEGQDLVSSLPPGEVKRGAESGARSKQKDAAGIFDDMDRAEERQLAQIDRILDWLETQKGKLQHESGQFVFNSETQLTRFRTMVAELEKLEIETGNAQKAFNLKIARSVEQNAADLKRAQKVLAQ